MRPFFRVHRPPALALEPVVADRLGGAYRFLDVALLEQIAARRRPPPDACEAIRLKLEPHRAAARSDRLGRADLTRSIADAEQLLHVMSDLVGDHVSLGEIATRS